MQQHKNVQIFVQMDLTIQQRGLALLFSVHVAEIGQQQPQHTGVAFCTSANYKTYASVSLHA